MLPLFCTGLPDRPAGCSGRLEAGEKIRQDGALERFFPAFRATSPVWYAVFDFQSGKACPKEAGLSSKEDPECRA